VAELREEVAQTRNDLGETVEALAAKADVKARVQESAAEAKAKVRDKAADVGEKLKEGARDTASAGTALAGRAQDKAVQVREDARRNPVPYGVIVAGVLGAVVAIVVWRRRSR